MAPTFLSESKSSGRSRCSSVRQPPDGAADLHRLEFLAVLDAAADVEDDLAQRRAHRHLNQVPC